MKHQKTSVLIILCRRCSKAARDGDVAAVDALRCRLTAVDALVERVELGLDGRLFRLAVRRRDVLGDVDERLAAEHELNLRARAVVSPGPPRDAGCRRRRRRPWRAPSSRRRLPRGASAEAPAPPAAPARGR